MYLSEVNIMVVQLPANTSHFLQPCDSSINNRIKDTPREVRDIHVRAELYSNANIALTINLEVAGYRSLNTQLATQSFFNTGMWPMEFQFLDILCQILDTNSKVSGDSSQFHRKVLRMTMWTSDGILY